MDFSIEELEQERLLQKALLAVGNIPGSFSLAIYNLILDLASGHRPNEGVSSFQVSRLLSVPTLQKCLTEATKFYEVPWDESNGIPDLESVSLGSLFVSVYLHRRLKKICDSTEWGFITPQLYRDILIAGLIARAVCKQGMGVGILGVIGIYSGLGTFCALDKKAFKEYRRRRKADGFFFNPQIELELFGCTSIMVGGSIIQKFRFGPEITESFINGFNYSIPQSLLSQNNKQFRLIANILRAVHSSQKTEAIFESPALNLEPRIIERLKKIVSTEQQDCWIDKEISKEE